MKELPHKFQFRLSGDRFSGYTHTAKRNAIGDYEIKWARGWHKKIGQIDWVVATDSEVQGWVKCGGWIIVDDKPKQKNALPDEFCFVHKSWPDLEHEAVLDGDNYKITWNCGSSEYTPKEDVAMYVNDWKCWKIIDKPALTPEQQRQLKNFEEQVAQLDQSIKLNEQDICHKQRLISNYQERKEDLQEKIAEIKGEDSPKVVKAKQMKAEMGKLKGDV